MFKTDVLAVGVAAGLILGMILGTSLTITQLRGDKVELEIDCNERIVENSKAWLAFYQQYCEE